MPINPEIALQGRPVQIDTSGIVNMVAQGQARRMAMEQHAQQMQLGAQRIEEGKAAVQKSQIAARDQQIVTSAYLKNNGDPDATVREAIQGGASPDAVQGLQKHAADIREKIAKATSDELGTKKYQNEQMLGLHKQAIDLANSDPQAYAQAWPQFYAQAVKFDPEAAKHLDPNNPATVQQLQLSEAAYGTDEYLRKEAEAKRQQAAEGRAVAGEQRASMMAGPQLAKATAEASSANRTNDAALLAAAAKQGPDALAAAMSRLPADRQAPFQSITPKTTPDDILKLGMTPDQQTSAAHAAAVSTETARHNKVDESSAAGRLAVEQGNLALARKKNEMEYGAGTTEFWVHQLQDNPDSIKEMPPAMRSVVGKGFTATTGLPLPTALGGAAQTQETAARNALDNIAFIRKAVQNPEIRAQLGPLLGRLGDVEQRIGSAANLSPEAEALGQELRTRMRYFNLQEGKALLGGRPNAKLMETLAGSSANSHMDPGILEGSLKGAEGSANEIMDNADRQRFGGKMRSRETRGQGVVAPSATSAGHVIEVGGKHYRYKGTGPTDSMDSYAEVK